MTGDEATELARAYVALSNAHRSDLLRPLFAHDAIYRSTGVGEHRGVDAIIDMMRQFFERYPDVHWTCHGYRSSGRRVSFEFALEARPAGNAQPLRRGGVEHIDFDADGLIESLQVVGHDTAPLPDPPTQE